MSPSPERSALGRPRLIAGLLSLVVAVGLVTEGQQAWADTSPSATESPTVASSPGATADSLADVNAPIRDISLAHAPVFDIVVTVESLDGRETQEDTEDRRTLILDSRVLFAEDRAVVTPAAHARLRRVATQIRDAGATGSVRIAGYTDDQGSAAHGLVLSRQRAAAVRRVLAPLLSSSGVTLTTRGFGEADPRFPNLDKAGSPIPANRARNRRVEISFTPAQR